MVTGWVTVVSDVEGVWLVISVVGWWSMRDGSDSTKSVIFQYPLVRRKRSK